MLSLILPVRSLLLAIFILMGGSGFLSTLIGLRLERGGSSTLMIGAVATAYFVGLTVGAARVGPLVDRVGHIRAFAAFVSLLSASTLTYALLPHGLLWGVLRFIDGLCVAGIFVCLESWLNQSAEPHARGGTLASYMVALYGGQALGQLLLSISGAAPSLPFQLASILISLAVIPVCLTRMVAPQVGGAARLSMRYLYQSSPLGVVGAVTTGLMLGAFYGLAAVHIRRLGLDLSQTASFMMIVILGGVGLQLPLGRLSDRFDRRRVIVCCLGIAALVSAALAFIAQGGFLLLGFGALFGGLSFALYPLCVAHTNDRLEPSQRLAASGALVLLYSLGAAGGPLGGAAMMTLAGTSGLFLFIGLCAACAWAFGLWRQASTHPVPVDAQQSYQIIPRTTAVASLLDPNAPEEADVAHEDGNFIFVG